MSSTATVFQTVACDACPRGEGKESKLDKLIKQYKDRARAMQGAGQLGTIYDIGNGSFLDPRNPKENSTRFDP